MATDTVSCSMSTHSILGTNFIPSVLMLSKKEIITFEKFYPSLGERHENEASSIQILFEGLYVNIPQSVRSKNEANSLL